MSEIVVLECEKWKMLFEPDTGVVTTRYDCGAESRVELNPDHEFHAERMRQGGCEWMTASLFNLMHETAHHLVGGQLPVAKENGCMVIYHSAHGLKRPWPKGLLTAARVAEFGYTTTQYWSINQVHHGNEALVWLGWLGVDLERVAHGLLAVLAEVRDA